MNVSKNLTTGAAPERWSVFMVENSITVILCASISCFNGLLIHTFRQYQVLNTNPRYIIFIHLVVNDIILLCLLAILQVISFTIHSFNGSLCLLLIVSAILVNLNMPLTLALMGLESYVAIMFPLHHTKICTIKKTYTVLGLVWVTNSLAVLPDVIFIFCTRPLSFFSSRVNCRRSHIFNHPVLVKKQEISFIVLLVLVYLTLTFVYFEILSVARTAASNARKARKATKKILLNGFQLSLCVLNYTGENICRGLLSQYPQDIVLIYYVIAILVQVLPRLGSPLVYGAGDNTFRKCMGKILCGGRGDCG